MSKAVNEQSLSSDFWILRASSSIRHVSRSLKPWKLEAKARNSWGNCNHRFRPGRNVTRIMGMDRRSWTMVLFAMLGTMINVASSTTTIKAATGTATRSICSNTSTYGYFRLVSTDEINENRLPFDDTPAPISMSGSSITMPPSSARPPVPPCSAVNAHLRSASVSREMGMTLMPVW
jgi:hypothetical protein